MKAIYLLPCKGDSGRLRQKNVYPIHGKPMFIWSLQAIEASKYFAKGVYVMTESKDVAAFIALYKGHPPASGINVLWEKEGEQTSVVASVATALRKLAQLRYVEHGDAVCVVYPNCPARDLATIDRCIETLVGQKCNSVRTYSKGKETGNVWAFKFDTDILEGDFESWYTYTGSVADDAIEVHTEDDLLPVIHALRGRAMDELRADGAI